jgi:hypothetical protein
VSIKSRIGTVLSTALCSLLALTSCRDRHDPSGPTALLSVRNASADTLKFMLVDASAPEAVAEHVGQISSGMYIKGATPPSASVSFPLDASDMTTRAGGKVLLTYRIRAGERMLVRRVELSDGSACGFRLKSITHFG